MKKAKTLIGIAMIAVMVVVMCAFSASAAMTLNVTLDKTQLEPGDEVKATVSVNNYEIALAGFAVTINYDQDALTLTNVAPAEYANATAVVDPEDVADADGSIDLVWFTADFDGIVSVNKLADLTFVAKAESANAAISAGFIASDMIRAGEQLEAIAPEAGVYSDEVVNAPAIEVVPEGTFGGEEPEEPVGNGSANSESSAKAGYSEVGAYATYKVGDRTDMYRVEVKWGDMTFKYTEADETWDPADHAWVTDEVGTWEPSATDANKVELKNHSSKPVTVALAFADDATDSDVIRGAFDKSSIALAAVAGEGESAVVDADAAYLTLEGKFTNESTEDVELGTVTATIE